MSDWLLNLKSWTPRLHELANTNAASVFLVLVAHADMSGHSRPSVRTIGKQAGITARSVYNCLSLLKKVGAIQRVADSGKRKAVTYATGFMDPKKPTDPGCLGKTWEQASKSKPRVGDWFTVEDVLADERKSDA